MKKTEVAQNTLRVRIKIKAYDHKIVDQRPRAGSLVDTEKKLHLQLQAE